MHRRGWRVSGWCGQGVPVLSALRTAPNLHAARETRALEERASSRELLILGVYFGLLVALTDIFNVRLGIELLTLAVLVAAVAITRQTRLFIHDWWFVLVGMVMWNLSGPIAAQSTFPLHLDFMLNTDRALFFGHDPVALIQLHLKSAHVTWLDVVTGIVYNMHLAEPYIAGYFLWRLNRLVYLRFVASALILLVLGFITFIVYPAIPPWLAASEYGRLPGVENLFGRVLRWHPLPFHGTPIFYVFKLVGDPVAAMPSEHAAFPMLEFLAFARFGRTVAVLFALWVLAVLFSIIYLGEHWVTDALAGWLYAIVIFAAVSLLTGRRGHDTAQRS